MDVGSDIELKAKAVEENVIFMLVVRITVHMVILIQNGVMIVP